MTPSTTVASLGRGDRAEDVHQLGLAVVAAVDVVQPVRGALHLVGHDRRPAKPHSPAKRPAVGLLVAGQRRRHRGDRVRIGAEHAVGDRGEERRVGTAAERDDDPFEPMQFALEDDVRFGDHAAEATRVPKGAAAAAGAAGTGR